MMGYTKPDFRNIIGSKGFAEKGKLNKVRQRQTDATILCICIYRKKLHNQMISEAFIRLYPVLKLLGNCCWLAFLAIAAGKPT